MAAGGDARCGLIDVMMVDLDWLESINDTMGRPVAGDGEVTGSDDALGGKRALLGLEVVAEGAETPEQGAFLRANGRATAKRFLYTKPITKVGDNVAAQATKTGRSLVRHQKK